MQIRTTNLILSTAMLALAVGTATDATAQSSYKSKSYSKSVGNSNFGGRLSTYVRANYRKSTTSTSGGVYARLSATGRLLGKSAEIAYVRGSGSVRTLGRTVNYQANVFVRVAGKTIVNKNGPKSLSIPLLTRTYNLFRRDLTKRVPVYGPIFVTVRGNVGIGMKFGARVAFPTNRTDLSGYGRTWAYARASASAGVPEVLEVGLEVKGNAADQTLSFVLGSRPSARRLTGKVVYSIRAISLKLSAFVLAIVPFPTCWKVWKKKCWQKKFSFKLTSWSSNKVTKTLLNLF